MQHETPNCAIGHAIIATFNRLDDKAKLEVAGLFFTQVANSMPTAPKETAEPAEEVPPLTALETEVLDFLKRAPQGDDGLPMPFSGSEIASALDRSYNYIKTAIGPSAPLRQRGLVTHTRNVGYRIGLHLLQV